MSFKGTKFQVVRYGHDEDLKNDTLYFTYETKEVIERFYKLKDLGVIRKYDATFDAHVELVVRK